MSNKYLDELYDLKLDFKSEEEAAEYFNGAFFAKWVIKTWGLKPPVAWTCTINGKKEYFWIHPTKQGVEMDWEYFSELVPITPEAIAAESNTAKRTLLMMEYGIVNYLEDIKELQTDVYGTLLEARLEGELQRFVLVRNGTKEPESKQQYLREKNMLFEDGHRKYYIPVPFEPSTAKEAVEWSFKLPYGFLPEAGWDFES